MKIPQTTCEETNERNTKGYKKYPNKHLFYACFQVSINYMVTESVCKEAEIVCALY